MIISRNIRACRRRGMVGISMPSGCFDTPARKQLLDAAIRTIAAAGTTSRSHRRWKFPGLGKCPSEAVRLQLRFYIRASRTRADIAN